MNTKKGPWKNWQELCSDVNWQDYHGMWGFHAGGGEYYVIRHTNMIDACGESDAHEIGYVHESVVLFVDLDTVPANEIKSAPECCGQYDVLLSDDPPNPWIVVECLVSYGRAAPLDTFTCAQYRGKSAKFESNDHFAARTRADARRHVESLIDDREQLDNMLDRPVNRIGSTAREYAAGDFASAIGRGLMNGEPRAELMARIGVGRSPRAESQSGDPGNPDTVITQDKPNRYGGIR